MTTIPALRSAVEERFGCLATLREIVQVVREQADGSAWEGPVAVFNVIGHRSAGIAYAWYDPTPTSEGRRLHAVLHAGPVESAATAVRLSIGDSAASERAS